MNLCYIINLTNIFRFAAEVPFNLDFGIHRSIDLVPSLNLGTEGKVFKFEFTADFGGVYVILACLFGTPIAHNSQRVTIARGKGDNSYLGQSQQQWC